MGDNAHLYQGTQSKPGGGFGEWSSVGQLYIGAPAMSADVKGDLYAFSYTPEQETGNWLGVLKF